MEKDVQVKGPNCNNNAVKLSKYLPISNRAAYANNTIDNCNDIFKFLRAILQLSFVVIDHALNARLNLILNKYSICPTSSSEDGSAVGASSRLVPDTTCFSQSAVALASCNAP